MRWIVGSCVHSILGKPEGRYIGVTKIMKVCSKEMWHDEWAGIAQSVQRLTTVWTVRGSNPGAGEIFRTRPDRPTQPPIQGVLRLSRR
jgi:hypothetical protein